MPPATMTDHATLLELSITPQMATQFAPQSLTTRDAASGETRLRTPSTEELGWPSPPPPGVPTTLGGGSPIGAVPLEGGGEGQTVNDKEGHDDDGHAAKGLVQSLSTCWAPRTPIRQAQQPAERVSSSTAARENDSRQMEGAGWPSSHAPS